MLFSKEFHCPRGVSHVSCVCEYQEQPHEHQSMEGEVEACRKVFGSVELLVFKGLLNIAEVGDAFVLGPLTGEHWLFYDAMYLPATQQHSDDINFESLIVFDSTFESNYMERGDFTIDVMMYDLPKAVQEALGSVCSISLLAGLSYEGARGKSGRS